MAVARLAVVVVVVVVLLSDVRHFVFGTDARAALSMSNKIDSKCSYVHAMHPTRGELQKKKTKKHKNKDKTKDTNNKMHKHYK